MGQLQGGGRIPQKDDEEDDDLRRRLEALTGLTTKIE
jgi:hypothetical protein